MIAQRVRSLVAILAAALACPPISRAGDFRTETCKGPVAIDLGDRSPLDGGWLYRSQAKISPGRALELADHALRRSGLLGRRSWALEITFVALLRPQTLFPDRFYRIHYAGTRCPKGEGPLNHAFVLVGLDGTVLLPAAVGGGRDPAPLQPQPPRWDAPRQLAEAYDVVLAGYEKLAAGLEQTYKGVKCSLVGCPGYDLVLSSVSYEDGPPDVKIDAGSLPARVLWFPRQAEWPQLSPAEAVARAIDQAVELSATRYLVGRCDPRDDRRRFVPGLRRARPGGWLYVLQFEGRRCDASDDSRYDHLEGELVVLMTGDVLLPTDGAFSWLPKNPEDDTTVDGMVFYNLLYKSPSRRRFRPPDW